MFPRHAPHCARAGPTAEGFQIHLEAAPTISLGGALRGVASITVGAICRAYAEEKKPRAEKHYGPHSLQRLRTPHGPQF